MDYVLGVKVTGKTQAGSVRGVKADETGDGGGRRLGALLHALRRLSGHVDAAHGVKLGFGHVQVAVEAAALAPLRDDGEVGLGHVAHE